MRLHIVDNNPNWTKTGILVLEDLLLRVQIWNNRIRWIKRLTWCICHVTLQLMNVFTIYFLLVYFILLSLIFFYLLLLWCYGHLYSPEPKLWKLLRSDFCYTPLWEKYHCTMLDMPSLGNFQNLGLLTWAQQGSKHVKPCGSNWVKIKNWKSIGTVR